MEAHLHLFSQWSIRRFFLTGRPLFGMPLYETLERCPRCAEYYQRHQAIEAALCGKHEHPTPFALDRVEALVLDAVCETDADPVKDFPWGRWLPAAAGAVGAVALVLGLLFSTTAPRSDRRVLTADQPLAPVGLMAKGGSAQAASEVGIRVFRVQQINDSVEQAAQLTNEDIITFTYTYIPPKEGYLALFGIQTGGTIRWYYPEYGDQMSIPITGDVIDEPLGDGIDLSVNHQPGWLRLVSLFSPRPLSVDAIETSVQALAAQPGAIKQLSPLSFGDGTAEVVEHTVLVEVR